MRRWEEIRIRQHRLLTEVDSNGPTHLDHIMKSGFTKDDIKNLNRNYSEDAAEADDVMHSPSRPPRKTEQLDYNGGSDVEIPYDDEDEKKKRGRSPFRLFGKKRDASRDKAKEDPKLTTTGRSVVQASMMARAPTVRVSGPEQKLQAPVVPERKIQTMTSSPSTQHIESFGSEVYDSECLKLINEYFYGVRIFPGQDPTHIYVGWVTTQYHTHTKEFKQDIVRRSSIVIEDDYENVMEW